MCLTAELLPINMYIYSAKKNLNKEKGKSNQQFFSNKEKGKSNQQFFSNKEKGKRKK